MEWVGSVSSLMVGYDVGVIETLGSISKELVAELHQY